MLYDHILQTIGKTPLVKINRIGQDLDCNLFGKCEYFNPGGSVKDRIAYNMVLDAQKRGLIKPGDTLIEPTSGNTGIGLCLTGAVLGYKIIITMPEKMSKEKQVVMESLGAKIIRTPTEAAWDSAESHIGVAKKLNKEIKNSHILDQYANTSNPESHYSQTAEEIWSDLDGKVDMVVITAGTGGTIAGISKKLKEKNPEIKIIGVDPVGSILAGPAEIKSYHVEGIGYDFIPEVIKDAKIDQWLKCEDKPSFQMSRRIIQEEGLLVGGSSGAAMYCALKAAASLKKDQNCVVLLPDGVRNYLTKFLTDSWMRENNFMD